MSCFFFPASVPTWDGTLPCSVVHGKKPKATVINSPLCQTTNETCKGRKLPGEGGSEVLTHVGRLSVGCQVERSLSAYTQRTRRCVFGPGLEAAGLLCCSRWCTFLFYTKTLRVGSKEEALSSIPVSDIAVLTHWVAARMVILFGCSLFWNRFLDWWGFQKWHNQTDVSQDSELIHKFC